MCAYFTCKADTTQRDEDNRTHLCREREKSQKLETEVERLNENLEIAEENLASLRMSLAQEEKRAIHFQHYCKKSQDMYNYHLVATSEADERAEKAEAEVERIREQLQQAVDIAEWYMDNLIDSPRKVALDEIKATMNPTDK